MDIAVQDARTITLTLIIHATGIGATQMRQIAKFVYIYHADKLHLCTFKTPTCRRFMSAKVGSLCAFEMRKGVNIITSLEQSWDCGQSRSTV
jgi:hypothetical protein